MLAVFASFDGTDQKLLGVEAESIARGGELTRLVSPNVIAIGEQDSRFFRVDEVGRDHLVENLTAKRGILQAKHHFHAFVNVALHPIGATQIDFRVSTVAESEDAAVFQEAPNDASNANAAADAANTRAQSASSAHDQFNLDAGLRGAVESLDDFLVE